MKHAKLATLVPNVEWFELPKRSRREDVMATNHIDAHVTGWGQPAVGDGERFLSRWGGGGQLFMTYDDDGGGPRTPDNAGGSFHFGEFAQGTTSIGITDRRLLVTVTQGRWVLGGIDERKNHKVLVVSWPYEEVATVELEWKTKMMGGKKARGASVTLIDPPAALKLITIFPVNEKWDSSMVPKDDMPGFTAAVVAAAGPVRLAQATDPGERARLEAVVAGQRTQEDGDEVAWLTDPDS